MPPPRSLRPVPRKAEARPAFSSRPSAAVSGSGKNSPVAPAVFPAPALSTVPLPANRNFPDHSADSFEKQVEFLFADGSERRVMGFVDSGCFAEAVDRKWLMNLGLFSFAEKLPVARDIILMDGRIVKNAITHRIRLTYRIGEQIFDDWFFVQDLGTHPVAFGLTWLKKYNPDINWINGEITELRAGPDHGATLTRAGNHYVSQDVSRFSGVMTLADTVLPLRSSVDPSAAFSAGGVISAIDAEIARRDLAADQAFELLRCRSALLSRLDDLDRAEICPTAMRSSAPVSSAPSGPEVRGLTGNKEGWLETIPPQFRRFADTVFSDESARKLPPHRPGIDCAIKIKDGETLSTCKIYDMTAEELSALKALIDEELSKGFIRPSQSSASSPVFFVRDPSSTSRGKGQLRLVVDYRSLNTKVVLDEYPIPLIRTVMERLPSAKVFTKFDVRSGFANIRVAPGDEWKTAFKTFYGLYEYQVMPMGLATAPAVFQRFINHVLAPYLDVFVFAYLDDIIVFSSSFEEHDEHVTKVLQALEKNELHLKPSKCVWRTDEISFLGFTAVAGKGLRMSDDKLEAMRNWSAPSSVRDVRSFLGLTNFYHDFVPHYSDVTAPLTDLTKKDVVFEWTPRHQAAFDRLKSCLRNDVFLAAFDPDRPITLETDASDVAAAGVISQPDASGTLRPVIMFSHKFKDAEKNWTVHDKELYAIVYAFDRYRHFLAAPRLPVSVYTDHRNLARFMTSTKLSGRLARWWEQLSGCNFQIQYRPGVENPVADALSRFGEADYGVTHHALLPRFRFSSKALADIDNSVTPVPSRRSLPLDETPYRRPGLPREVVFCVPGPDGSDLCVCNKPGSSYTIKDFVSPSFCRPPPAPTVEDDLENDPPPRVESSPAFGKSQIKSDPPTQLGPSSRPPVEFVAKTGFGFKIRALPEAWENMKTATSTMWSLAGCRLEKGDRRGIGFV